VIDRLVILGATGDLAARFLFPALAELDASGRLAPDFAVTGTGREHLDAAEFRDGVDRALGEHAPDLDAPARARFLRSVEYRSADITDAASLSAAMQSPRGDGRPVAVYLALPPATFLSAVETLAGVGLPEGSRVALEKPFGEDLQSARTLNRTLARVTAPVGESAIFRVDHVLGMATVHNLVGARLANTVLADLWDGEHVDRVEIVWDETLALEGRAGYYDGTGALADVIQNHLLQILALVAMEPPPSLAEHDLRDAKAELLRAVRPPSADDVTRCTRRARYTAGLLAGDTGGNGRRRAPAYVDEQGVDPARNTETFAEVELVIDNPRWRRTSFLLRSGKALRRRRKGVIVRFREAPALPFGDGLHPLPPNELRIGLDGPETFSLHLTGTNPGPPTRFDPMTLSAALPADDLPAYGRVLLDLLEGDCTLSIRGDETERAWEIVTPVIDGWRANRVPMQEYPAGSDGPPAR
jgi:glucose-6-phosphate 1-dehydrogenase